MKWTKKYTILTDLNDIAILLLSYVGVNFIIWLVLYNLAENLNSNMK